MRFKKINPNEKVFFVFEISETKFSIFDSFIDEPIYNGSWAMCEGIIKNIKKDKKTKDAKIYYYKFDQSGLKLEPLWSYNL